MSKLKEFFKTGKTEGFLMVNQYLEGNEGIDSLEKEAFKKAEVVASELVRQLKKDESTHPTFRMNFGEGVVVELDKSNPKSIIYIKHYDVIAGKVSM